MTVQRILAVVVVYCQHWANVASANYLISQLNADDSAPEFKIDRLIVYDNSPTPLALPILSHSRIDYKHNADNGGTRSAYEYALAAALRSGHEWILLLDQDTYLPDNFCSSLIHSRGMCNISQADVLLPQVEDRGRYISPSRINAVGSIVPLTMEVLNGEAGCNGITGIASGSLIRTLAFCQVPTFPPELWLDFVDHWLFHQLNLLGSKFLFIDVTLQHELSILSMSKVSRQRLFGILNGERIFAGSLGTTVKLIYPIRLVLRFVRLTVACPSAAKDFLAWFWLKLIQ